MKYIFFMMILVSSASAEVQVFSNTPNYQELNEKIIVPKCLQCHNENFAARQVYLVNYEDLKSLSVAGNPDASLLYEALTEKALVRMPFGKSSLNVQEINYIKSWIVAGMPEK